MLPNDRVITSRYVYKIKRNSKTGAACRLKARFIVRGFEMEKHVDYDENFSLPPSIALARIIALARTFFTMSLQVAKLRPSTTP